MSVGRVVDAVESRAWRAFVRRRFPNVEIGSHVTVHGLPIVKVAGTGRLVIGDGVVLTSRARTNMVGLSRRCSIEVRPAASVTIGPGSGLSGVAIVCASRVAIGSHVMCGGNVSIWDTDFHPLQHLERRRHAVDRIATAPVEIEDDVFVGANALILKGVRIGARAIIGAGSVVTRDVPPDSIWAGNPAAPVREVRVERRPSELGVRA
jgi:serine acetyltransferase